MIVEFCVFMILSDCKFAFLHYPNLSPPFRAPFTWLVDAVEVGVAVVQVLVVLVATPMTSIVNKAVVLCLEPPRVHVVAASCDDPSNTAANQSVVVEVASSPLHPSPIMAWVFLYSFMNEFLFSKS